MDSQETRMESRLLKPTDAAYIPGLVDGEGTVTLTRKYRNENRQLCISISNTERMLLEYVHRTIVAGKITGKRTTKACHTPSYTYAVYNRQALSLLIQIQPYLQTYKARRAALIIRDYIALTPRNGKYSAEHERARAEFEVSLLAIKAGG